MAHAWAIVLGVVQGLTEFLPISSSGHLVLVPWLFGVTDPILTSLPFDIALHAGSAIAIVIALWSEWADLARGAFSGGSSGEVAARRTRSRRFIGFLALTSFPGAAFGILLEKKAETVLRNPLLIASTLLVMGALLWLVDKYAARQDPLETMTWGKAGVIGLAQAAAIVPGVSRSGVTITAARALGLSRESSASYSFMAALPIIAGAVFFGLRNVPLSELFSVDWVLGFLSSAISSFLAMRLLLDYVRQRSYAVFFYYRVAVSVLVVAVAILRG